jgi:hypothetical protein
VKRFKVNLYRDGRHIFTSGAMSRLTAGLWIDMRAALDKHIDRSNPDYVYSLDILERINEYEVIAA